MRDHVTIAHHIFLLIMIMSACRPGTAIGQIFELPRADPLPGDFFGTAVAIDGRRVLVGATGDDACGPNSGAAYVYELLEGTEKWVFAAELLPSECEEGRFFGRSVALSENFAAVAASQEFFSEETPNAVYVFERDSLHGWHQIARLVGGHASDEGAFGTSVSMDGERILVTTSGDPAGGAFNGALHIFALNDEGQWERTSRFSADDTRAGILGTAGAIAGDYAVVSASTYFRYKPGTVYFFERDRATDTWSVAASFGDIDDFFISVDADSNRAIVGESKAGRNASGQATIFERDAEGQWKKAHRLQLDKPYDFGAFGTDVAIDGEYALVAAYDEQLGLNFNIDRVVYVFRRTPEGRWIQHQVIDVGEVAFGASLDIHNGYAVVGSAADAEPGAAYVVRLVE
jgi:hypothetical protein